MVEVKLLTSGGCAACKAARESIKKVLKEFRGLKVMEVDILEHPEAVVKYDVMGTPVVIIGERVVSRGAVREDELRKKLMEVINKNERI